MSLQSDWLKNNQRQLDADGVEVGVSRQALNEVILEIEAQEKERRILLGVLGSPKSDMRIGHEDQQWVLSTGEGDSYEVLIRHENWTEFLKLVEEYSDYEGDD